MTDKEVDAGAPSSGLRTLLAMLVGLGGALVIWVAAPLNDCLLGNAPITDGYMPVAALSLVTFLVLGANPLLRRLAPALALNSRQLAVVFAVLLVASIAPGPGLLGFMPAGLTSTCTRVSQDKPLAEAFAEVDAPPGLFPAEVGYDKETPVSSGFQDELGPNESIPWAAWVPPLFSWGGFLLPWTVMMIALAVIVLPQWRDNERLALPLLAVQQAFIEDPQQGRFLPAIFRSPGFWAAALIVFGLRSLAMVERYFPGQVPVISLRFDIYACFKTGILVFVPWWVQMCPLNFVFIGLAYFMPSRIGFSVWFFQILYAVYIVFRCLYMPPFHYGEVADQSNGAFLALPLFVLWLGRQHWAAVARRMFSRAKTDEDRRDRAAGYAFVIGCGGMFAWLVWVGVLPLWALGLVVLAVLYALAITRVVAETGVPLTSTNIAHTLTLVRMLPIEWRTAASMYFSAVAGVFNSFVNRVCVMTMALHGLGMDRKASPRRQLGLGGLFVVVIALSVAASGAVYLYCGYRHTDTLDGKRRVFSAEATGALVDGPVLALQDWAQKKSGREPQDTAFHIAAGALLTLALMHLCMMSPRWPLHPIAFLVGGMVSTYLLWFNVFLGWLAKVLILHFGGARTFSRARPFFVGLIIGEVLTSAFWTGLAGILAGHNLPYQVLG